MNYVKIANKVYKKLKQFGGSCFIKRNGEKTYDKTTHSYTSTDIIINGVALMGDIVIADGSLQTRSHVAITVTGNINIMAVLDSAPEIGDIIHFENYEYTIIDVKPVDPSGKNILYYNIQAK